MKEHQDKDSKLMLLKTEFVNKANSILAIAFTKDREKVSTASNALIPCMWLIKAREYDFLSANFPHISNMANTRNNSHSQHNINKKKAYLCSVATLL